MADARWWSVTYTKHVKQKRKVYQDGLLELQVSRHKVALYDEGDKLLESKFVKKDDVIESGETLAFESYLVDIGELCGSCKPTSTVACQGKDSTFIDIPRSAHSYDCRSNSTSVEVRDREMIKHAALSSSPDVITSSTTEWQVLYTTQISQKAKKFHDGFLQLVVRGLGRQVMLYDITRRTLESRFLKKHEIVCSGESLAFEGHLVEIGEQNGVEKAATDIGIQEKDCKIVGQSDIFNDQAKLPTNKRFLAGKTPGQTSPGRRTKIKNSSSEVEKVKLSWGTVANEPVRAVHDILTVLRKPDATMNKTCEEKQHESLSKECNGNEDELKNNKSNQDCIMKVIKTENVNDLPSTEKCTVYGSRREYQASSSIVDHSSETTNNMPPILSVKCTDNKKLVSTSYLEPNSPVNAVLDSQNHKPIEPADLLKSNEAVEPENLPEIFSCEEILMETKAKAKAAVALNASKIPKDHHESAKNLDEFPSFDLGF
ncbi:uncharacterized protein LOC127261373 isoform X2 [Andrographis paniculata]|uniref:uncharacterized protein LOC127261373 isoform X2 n=1 Tax=Andrographis paniculata TaxID=175694 RepID=UPI0021E958E3|nr:uncharacterized protein LOC127261373 isoform X2 [Andrographis paniculata]